MALFSSLCPSPISPLPFRKPYSIPKILIAETLTPKTVIHRALSISISAQVSRYSALQSFRCCTNSASSVEGENLHSTRIIVKGLPQSTAEGFLTRIFSRFGKVSRVKMITDRKSKQSLGCAYVWFTNEESAQLAAKEMDGKVVISTFVMLQVKFGNYNGLLLTLKMCVQFLDGRFVVVMIAKPESPSSRLKSTPYKF